MRVQFSPQSRSELAVSFLYDPRGIELVKAVPGRRWDPQVKVWRIPAYNLRELQSSAARVGYLLDMQAEVRRALEAGERAKEAVSALRQVEDVDLILPTATVLYNFQRVGVRYLETALHAFHGVLLADDMGLGKSVQALSCAVLHPELKNILITCPATLKYNWLAEIQKHFPQLRATVIEGPPERRASLWAVPDTIKIVNYELVVRDPEPKLQRWDLVIADEVTKLRNYKTQTAKTLKKLKRVNTIGLSGTPIENRVEELHSIMDFIMPGLLGSGWQFMQEHAQRDYFGNVVGWKGLEKVKARIRPHYLRRLKSEVLADLPEKVYNDYWVEMSSVQWKLYDAVSEQIKDEIEGNARLTAPLALTKMLRLKQVTGSPALLGELEVPSAKLEALDEVIEAAEGHKVVVFTQFAELAKLVAARYQALLLYGDVKTTAGRGEEVSERQRLVQEFQRPDGPRVFVSTDAGAYGITLTAADIIVHLDMPYNPAVLRQREDRLHRIGQRNSVQVINLLARRTIDEQVRKILYAKVDLVKSIFDEDKDLTLSGLEIGRTDLLALLGGWDG